MSDTGGGAGDSYPVEVSEDELFYLQTRGIKEPAARQLLTFGFVKEAVNCLENDSLEEVILGKLGRRFKKIGVK